MKKNQLHINETKCVVCERVYVTDSNPQEPGITMLGFCNEHRLPPVEPERDINAEFKKVNLAIIERSIREERKDANGEPIKPVVCLGGSTKVYVIDPMTNKLTLLQETFDA